MRNVVIGLERAWLTGWLRLDGREAIELSSLAISIIDEGGVHAAELWSDDDAFSGDDDSKLNDSDESAPDDCAEVPWTTDEREQGSGVKIRACRGT